MSFNVGKNDREVPLEVFGGLCTEMAPSDLPLGVSPDCQDVEFIPGSVYSRRALRKALDSPFGTCTVTYGKSYKDNAGTIRNLWLDSSGNLWVEDVTNSPGTTTLLGTTTPGSYAKSITAFGREYIAISDTIHGADIPLQYDGTNLDRVTQDGPGAAPSVASVSIPAVAMAAAGAGPSATISSIVPTSQDPTWLYYLTADINVASGASAYNVGDTVVVTGTNATFNQTYIVVGIFGDTSIQVSNYFAAGTATYIGAGTVASISGSTLSRFGNVVTATTATAHQLQVGYQAQISGVPAQTIGTAISSIVINNENLSGLATVTTSSAHGLQPGLFVSITDVTAVTVGTSISSISRAGQVVTVVMTSAHGLSPGASVTISGVVTSSFNTTALVSQVTAPTVFTFVQVDVDASDTTGSVAINWPIPDQPEPTYFEVVAAPTATSFQVGINYSDSPSGGWTTGTVKYAWDGTFFVSSVISSTQFTYKQYGPNASTANVGKVTPYGQIAPGIHQLQVAFLTRQGYITAPSPPVQFVAAGGQYLTVSNIPIGPSNIMARVLLFTGANGAYFFYIPVPAQVNGQVVSTSTVVNDNTTASVLLDFSDNTLYASLGTSIQGNNLARQIVLDGALGFGSFASRLFTYGQRNKVNSLLNMGFDGGYLPTDTSLPTGWNLVTGLGGLASGRYGAAWGMVVTGVNTPEGEISQPFYEDAYGAPIAVPDTLYKLRVWVKTTATGADLSFVGKISSASAGFSTTAAFTGLTTAGGWMEATFGAKTPASIPADLVFSIYSISSATNATVTVDDMSLVYAKTPYRIGTLWSYANNPEAFDGVAGQLGPKGDGQPVFGAEVIRNNLYLWTQDPSGRLHVTDDNGVSEPVGWQVNEVAANCGLLSTFGLTVSQADDSSGSGAEEWAQWASNDGAMIFSGATPEKISQEIQPDWATINSAHATRIWCLNDYVNRIVFYGLPVSGASAPNLIYPLSYRQLNTASAIAGSPPFRVGLSGKLVASDNTRKWTRWNLAMNGGALMYRDTDALSVVLLCGNGSTPIASAGFGNAYTLGPVWSTDDDYGQITPYYVTAPLVGNVEEAALQLGSHRKLLAYYTSFVSGLGALNIQVFCDSLSNQWPLVGARPLIASPKNDLEWAGGSASAQRFFIRNISTPVTGTDNGFTLNHMVAVIRTLARLPVRGAPQS